MVLELDQDRETLLKLRGDRFQKLRGEVHTAGELAWQHLANLGTNVRKFLVNDFHMKAGMRFLIESFYGWIIHNAPPPIPNREILLVARMMDCIFSQLDSSSGDSALSAERDYASA